MDEPVRRRHVLAGTVTLLGVGLAGCSDDNDDTEDNDTDDGEAGGGY